MVLIGLNNGVGYIQPETSRKSGLIFGVFLKLSKIACRILFATAFISILKRYPFHGTKLSGLIPLLMTLSGKDT
jgi:hypothetical protein